MDKMTLMEARMHKAEERIRQLEQHIHYPNTKLTEREQLIAAQEAAVRTQALYAPLRDQPNMKTDVGALLAYKDFIKKIAHGELPAAHYTECEAKRLLGEM